MLLHFGAATRCYMCVDYFYTVANKFSQDCFRYHPVSRAPLGDKYRTGEGTVPDKLRLAIRMVQRMLLYPPSGHVPVVTD